MEHDDDGDRSVEQQVIFDDDDDESEDGERAVEELLRRSTRGTAGGAPFSLAPARGGRRADADVGVAGSEDPLRDFRPLEDAQEEWKAASSLETFLTVESDTTSGCNRNSNSRNHDHDDPPTRRSTAMPNEDPAARIPRSSFSSPMANTNTLHSIDKASSEPLAFSSPQQSVTASSSVITMNTPATITTTSRAPQTSLLDESEDSDGGEMELPVKSTTTRDVPGAAGFLEMEEDPSCSSPLPAPPRHQHQSPAPGYEQPIRTASGLLLTHRRPTEHLYSQQQEQQQQQQHRSSYKSPPPVFRQQQNHSNHPHAAFNLEHPQGHPPPQRLPPPGTASKSFRGASGHGVRSTNSIHRSWWDAPDLSRALLLQQPKRLLRCVRLGVSLSALAIVLGTVLLVHHTRSAPTHPRDGPATIEDKTTTTTAAAAATVNNAQPQQQWQTIQLDPASPGADKIVLLPLPMMEQQQQQQHGGEGLVHVRRAPPNHSNTVMQQQHHRRLSSGVAEESLHSNNLHGDASKQQQQEPALGMHLPPNPLQHQHDHDHNHLQDLMEEFESWVQKHNKKYHSRQEKQRRFHIWKDNHHRTKAKNERHGPCRMTGRTVFGSNHFQDLTADEFRNQYLNAAHLERKPAPLGHRPPEPLQPRAVPPTKRHETVHHRFVEHVSGNAAGSSNNTNNNSSNNSNRKLSSRSCKWYDVSCHLRYIFETYFYGFGRTMEPAYDGDSYPTAVDWRDIGAVTEVHSQGSCGACWAITAVETIESVNFIATGTLYDLAETEVIVCQKDCEMCAGGWPQDAFDYVMDNSGLPLEENMPYDGDWLLMISDAVAGDSDQLDSSTVQAYQQQTCPGGGGGGGGGGGSNSNSNDSGDSGDNYYVNDGSVNDYQRYGKIDGYGYSTSKCVCYTDGSGCGCDNQNEGMAVRNLATYGPAVVCLDASTWQDYTDGILSSDSGCSSGFMDVNHCVQAVGYAYFEEEDEGSGSGDNKNRDLGSNSGDGSGSGSGDNSKRTGYWIVRNQWSSYWGMSGFAYVAMGENTCGILNDMLQAYT